MNKADKLLKLVEAALLLGVSKITLRRWSNQGILPSIRIGKRKDRRFREEDIVKYLANHTQTFLEEETENSLEGKK